MSAAPPAVEVLQLRPALLKPRAFAAYRGVSVSLVNAERAADTKAIREGRAPAGCPWVVIGSSVFYRLADADAWIAANAVERGVVQFSNRGRP